MWIVETKTGRYSCTERYTDPMSGRQKTVSVTIDRNTPQQRKIAARRLNDRISGILSNATMKNDTTLRHLGDLYLANQKLTVKESTRSRNVYAVDGLCRILGGDTIVDRMTAGYVKARLLEEGEAPGTMNERIKRLKALLRWGYQNDMIEHDITGKLNTFHDVPHRKKIEHKFLSSAEYAALLAEMDRKDYKLLTQFMVLSGLRYGEAAALDRADIDLEERLIHVTKTYDSNNKVLTDAKTYSSIRDVYIQDELLPVVHNLLKYMRERQMLHRIRTDIFFHTINGERLSYFTFHKYLAEMSQKSIGRDVTPHTLRHTHASLMFAAGVPMDVISRRLGHHTSRVTRDIYVHVTKELKNKDIEMLKAVRL